MNALIALAAATLLAGCATAPDGLAPLPDTPLPPQFRVGPDFEAAPATNESTAWWHEFNEPILSSLVAEALQRNLDIEAALARVLESRALLDAGRSTKYPRMDLAAGASRSRASLEDPARDPTAPRTGSRWSADATVSWETDLFGRRDAENRAFAWRAEARAARANAVRLAIAADVALRALELAALHERLQLAADAVAVEQDLLDLAKAKFRGGQASLQDVSRSQAEVSRSLAALTQLRLNRADSLAALAVLLAATPDEVGARVNGLRLPAGTELILPLVAPSEMLLGRPDVQAAMAELRATSADLAATAAQRYPRLDIAATLGWVAATASGLGGANALAASLVPGLQWRALDFGELDARLAGRKAAERSAAADYKAAVTRAFSEAQTALLQLQQQRELVTATQESLKAQQAVCDMQRAQYAAGLSDMALALESCRQLHAAAGALVQARRDALAGRIGVHKALGSGSPQATSEAG
jgi:NodT family efflux transporter outer membrane factor (OMF) lipoprotein